MAASTREQERKAALEMWARESQENYELVVGEPDFDVSLLYDKPRPLRMLRQADIACPAGVVAQAGRACLCRIENHLLTLDDEVSSLQAFCLNGDPMGGYQTCPTKQDDRQRALEGRESLAVRG